MSEIKPPPPIVILPASSDVPTRKDNNSPFRFGLPTTPSTFKPLHPITDTPSSALRKEFKFGLPTSTSETMTAEKPKTEEPARRVTRSSSPAKRAAEEEERSSIASPVKRQRSSSPQKKGVEKKEEGEEGEDVIEVKDTIEVKTMPSVFGSKLNPEAKPFSFGATTDTMTTTTTGKSDMFSMGSTTSGVTTDTKPTFSFDVGKKDDDTPKPAFNHSTQAEDVERTKPTFSFFAPPKDVDTTKPTFNFPASTTPTTTTKKDYTWTPDKPIKFDTPPQSMTSSAKPAPPSSVPFTFGQPSGPTQPFKFGGLATPIPASPKFGTFGSPSAGFGSAFTGQNVSFTSPNLGFSFGQSPPATTKPESSTVTTEAPAAADPAEVETGETVEAEDEPPVVSAEVGTEGEEDEETVFSERAKLILRLSNKERQKEIEKKGGNPNDVPMDRDYGVGVVRVNVHNETKKGRILFRLEGSGRAVLVTSLSPTSDP
jgi:hypothetical protein